MGGFVRKLALLQNRPCKMHRFVRLVPGPNGATVKFFVGLKKPLPDDFCVYCHHLRGYLEVAVHD